MTGIARCKPWHKSFPWVEREKKRIKLALDVAKSVGWEED
jgi:hypothetical protein